DRFHPIPATPEFSASWAEWLYFNGHTADGTLRFYITFLAGPRSATPGRRDRRDAASRIGAGSRHRRQPRAARGAALPDRAGAAGRRRRADARRRAGPIVAAGDPSRRPWLAERLRRAGLIRDRARQPDRRRRPDRL